MSDKLPQSTKTLIQRLRRAAVGIDKLKTDLLNPLGAFTKPEALSAYANTCWQAAGRLEELAETIESYEQAAIEASFK